MKLINEDSLEHPQTFKRALEREQESLWEDLSSARQDAIGCEWSIRCGNIAARIVDIARLIGHTPWDHIPETLLFEGVYEALLHEAGLPITFDEIKALDRYRAGKVDHGHVGR